jgi:ATP-dependent DNA helicase RecG
LANIVSQIPNLIQENLPFSLMKSLKLMSRQEAYLNIHFPVNAEYAKHADRRLKFEEAFFFQLGYALKKITIRVLPLEILSQKWVNFKNFTKISFLLN